MYSRKTPGRCVSVWEENQSSAMNSSEDVTIARALYISTQSLAQYWLQIHPPKALGVRGMWWRACVIETSMQQIVASKYSINLKSIPNHYAAAGLSMLGLGLQKDGASHVSSPRYSTCYRQIKILPKFRTIHMISDMFRPLSTDFRIPILQNSRKMRLGLGETSTFIGHEQLRRCSNIRIVVYFIAATYSILASKTPTLPKAGVERGMWWRACVIETSIQQTVASKYSINLQSMANHPAGVWLSC